MQTILPLYLDEIPSELEEGKLYISKLYKTAVHLCACGCKNKTVTPFNESGDNGYWKLMENNGNVSLEGSIGNYQFPCKSHYLIQNNKIKFC